MKKVLLILLLSPSVFAQTGDTFQIEQSTIATGGGRNSGGNFLLDSTAGQMFAGGVSQNSPFSIQSGFWAFNLVPTAAQVSIGGRVTAFNGQGIRNARVMLTAPNGETRFSLTGSYGFYRFDEIPVGETYILTVFSKRFVFANQTQVVTVHEELANLDFTAIEQ